MRLPAWMSRIKIDESSVAIDDRQLFDVYILDGHNGSGSVRLRRTLLSTSPFIALADALEAWQPDKAFESGAISIHVTRGWLQRGGYRNESGVALLERPENTRSLLLTEFDGTVTTFASDAEAWTYLQDHHYQSVNS